MNRTPTLIKESIVMTMLFSTSSSYPQSVAGIHPMTVRPAVEELAPVVIGRGGYPSEKYHQDRFPITTVGNDEKDKLPFPVFALGRKSAPAPKREHKLHGNDQHWEEEPCHFPIDGLPYTFFNSMALRILVGCVCMWTIGGLVTWREDSKVPSYTLQEIFDLTLTHPSIIELGKGLIDEKVIPSRAIRVLRCMF